MNRTVTDSRNFRTARSNLRAKIGYGRVSSKDQNLARQAAALKKEKVFRIFTDEARDRLFTSPTGTSLKIQ